MHISFSWRFSLYTFIFAVAALINRNTKSEEKKELND